MTEIENILQKTVSDNKSPSIQYILFDKDSIIKKYSCGFSDISGNKNISDNTTYNAYSVTKTFTALAILQLAQQKKIDIELPVKKYLPGFPYSSDISIRQLLSHSAGIPNPNPLDWIHLTIDHKSFDRNKFFEGIFLKNNKTKFQPNQSFAYSNLGYVLLGQLIEKVTETSYEQYVKENIIKKLALKEDELDFEIPNPNFHAKGYHKKLSITNLVLGFFINKSRYMSQAEGKWKPFNSFYVNGASYGGLIGTPDAFVKYLQELLKPNNLLLPDDYKQMMFTENHTTNNKATGMCLSWFTGRLNGIQYFAHAGGGGGYYCELRIYPEKGIGSVCFFNRTGMTDERFLDKVDKFYFNKNKQGNQPTE
ncbi:MAG TPA: serine hydrolase domain-containing protein [Ferruginibacter sp.]|nr:serine hydrolase domain-containing protein [Ferruginibacter sp.]